MKECRMKKSLKFCKCLPPFYHPKGVFEYCRVKDMECLAKHLSNITEIRGCGHCELSCDNTVYDIEKFSKTWVELQKLEKYSNATFMLFLNKFSE
jgi:acid-sensing ion channel, other